MPGAPPILAAPKGWKPPPGVQKATTRYMPKAAPPPKPTGPGYGVLRPGVRSAPAPRAAPAAKPPPQLFARPLIRATRENVGTGAALRQYRAENPKVAAKQYAGEHKVGVLGKILGGIGTGERFLESEAAKGIGLLQQVPGVTGRYHPESNVERKAAAKLYGGVGVQAALAATPFPLARGLRGAADIAETARAGKTLAGAAERAGLSEVATNALRGRELVPGTIAAKAPVTAKEAQRVAEVGARQASPASRALKLGAATAGGYGKLLVAAAPAKAATELTPEPKKHESFVEHLYRTSADTIANLPAGAIESAKHPLKTIEAMAQLYSHPQHAFEENPLGTALAFLAPYSALERGIGGVVRATTKDKWLSQERASLDYPVGIPKDRQYSPGAITQMIQKLPDKAAKAVGKGEKPLYSNVATKKQYNEATRLQAKRDLIGSRFGGLVSPGQIDLLHGGERTARNFDTMAGRHFLSAHLGGDELHNDALITLLQGEAKTAKTFWTDVPERKAQLEERAHGLTHEDKNLNQKQINKLNSLEANKSRLSTKDLEVLEKSAGEIATEQARLWRLANREGIGHEDQLNARNVGALLLHGHLLDRGELRFVREPSKEFMEGPRKPNKQVYPGVYDARGDRITQADVTKLLGEHFGGRELGFLNHKTEKVLARSNNTYGPRSTFAMRTGGNFLNGTYDNSAAALRQHFDTMAHNIAAMRGSRSVIEHMVLPDENGKWFEGREAAEAAAKAKNFSPDGQLLKPHLGKWVAYPVGARKAADLIEGSPFGRPLEQMGRVEALAQQHEPGVWGITPELISNRLNKWQAVEQHLQHGYFRMLTSPWRQVNLYTSVRWPFGTTQENVIRLAAHRVAPLIAIPYAKAGSLSFKTGADITKFLDEKINDPQTPPAQRQLAIFHRAMYGTGNFVGAQLHELTPSIDRTFTDNSLIRKIGESKYNIPNRTLWKPWRHFVGGGLNKMETNAKIAAGGKLALNDAGFFSKFRTISREQAAHDYVEKITTNPSESIRAGEKLLEIMGNWTHLTPGTREAQAEWAPFALWWLNSVKFVFQTMPRDHPIATGLLAAMVTATGTENRNLKSWLQGTVPLKLPFIGEVDANPVHYSPFDIGREPAQTAGSMILPQVTEPLSTVKGVNYLTGEKFEGEKIGEGSELTGVGRVLENALESFVPGARIAAQLTREGGKQTKTGIFPWEIKPGTGTGIGKAAIKTFSPLMFTYPKKEPTTSGTGWGTGGWGTGGKSQEGWGKGGW